MINNMKNKKVIRLTETDLHNIIKKSVKKIIKESFHNNPYEDDWDEEKTDIIDLSNQYPYEDGWKDDIEDTDGTIYQTRRVNGIQQSRRKPIVRDDGWRDDPFQPNHGRYINQHRGTERRKVSGLRRF